MIALVDCNNFYVSCERLFNPELDGKAVVVLSNNDGCVIARSNEAKAIGIEMGAPAFMIEKLLKQQQVAVFSSNYTLYGDISNRVMQTLQEFAPRIEVYSIDEAFLDLSQLAYQDLFQLGQRIRETVSTNIGMPITIGIAPTKTLAKMANRYAKKERKAIGVYLANESWQMDVLLQHTLVGDIWGIGKQHQKKLLQQNVHNAAQLLGVNEAWIRKNMTVVGQRLLNELKGIPSIAWEDMPIAKKGICMARSFGELLSDKKYIREALANYAAACAAKLRHQHSACNLVQVFLQTNAHRLQDKQYFRSVCLPLPVASNDAAIIMAAAFKGLDTIYRPGYHFKKVGIMVLSLVPEGCVQGGLFDKGEGQKEKKLMQVFDNVNDRFGKGLVRYGAQGYHTIWKLKQEKLSPCYTTDITQIPIIKC